VKKTFSIFIVLILCSSNLSAGLIGSIGGGLGATIPQGEFNDYTKTGFSIMGFGTFDPFNVPFLSLRLGLQGVSFENEGRTVFFEGYPGTPFSEIYSNSLYKATLGLEVSKGLLTIKPYAGAGFGIYYFESKTELKDDEDEVIASNKLSSKTKFGWNLNGGLKIYVIPKVAIDFNIQYDIVQDMEQYRVIDEVTQEAERVSFNSKFLSLFVGVSIPLGVF
jgi:Outer membrane protein beta-barrel domain